MKVSISIIIVAILTATTMIYRINHNLTLSLQEEFVKGRQAEEFTEFLLNVRHDNEVQMQQEGWQDIVKRNFPPSEHNHALAVVACESGGNPNAISKTDDHGLFQIHQGLWYGQQIYDPEFNTQVAFKKFQRRGWSPWTCAKKLGFA